MIAPQGNYAAKILEYALSETEKHDAKVIVRFGYDDSMGAPHTVTWTGLFSATSEKATEICLKALGVMGMGAEDLDRLIELADGERSGILDVNKQVSISVIHESYTKPTGETQIFAKVQWVNPLGGTAFKSAIDKNHAAQIIKGNALLKSIAFRMKQDGTIRPKVKAVDDLSIPF